MTIHSGGAPTVVMGMIISRGPPLQAERSRRAVRRQHAKFRHSPRSAPEAARLAGSTQPAMAVIPEAQKKEIYTYQAPWLIYGMNWSVRSDKRFRLALGSFLEDYTNKVEIIQLNDETGTFQTKGSFDHPYPPTKIMWVPDKHGKVRSAA